MYTYSIIITRNGQEIKKFLDFLPVLSIYFSIECQLLLEVKNKAIREAEQVCDFFRQKIYNNTATYEEREHYMELLKFRITGISSMVDIIPQLAAKIK